MGTTAVKMMRVLQRLNANQTLTGPNMALAIWQYVVVFRMNQVFLCADRTLSTTLSDTGCRAHHLTSGGTS